MGRISKRTLRPGERIRVLVVDDSVVIRRLVAHALDPDPALEVVGFAANGAIALARIPQLNPDLVTLDIEMPEMDGLEALRHIRRDYPGIRVVMVSTLTERGAAITIEALTLGADDYVTKVTDEGGLDRSLSRLRQDLIPKIKQFFFPAAESFGVPTPMAAGAARLDLVRPAAKSVGPVAFPPLSSTPPAIVAIGVSTGGPTALGRILPLFPADFPLPVLVVQHMPPMFTRLLAERLNSICRLPVREARDGEPVRSGSILIAPGDFHMTVKSDGPRMRIGLDQSPPLNSCRPAVDALFGSLAETYGAAVTAAVLTGMGYDGRRGSRLLKAKGAYVIAQDESSSVVWGMPGAVVEAGLADAILPLDRVSAEILQQASRAVTCLR